MLSYLLTSAVILLDIHYSLGEGLQVIRVKNGSTEIVKLEEERCAPRPTLVQVGGVHDVYFPLFISLHRCGGACGEDGVSTRSCRNISSTRVFVHVYDRLTHTNATLPFMNHTACGCGCVHQGDVCMATQVWNESTCACDCRQQPLNVTSPCGVNFQWNPQYCMCECDKTCSHKKKVLNQTSCSCECKPQVYQKCSRRSKIVRELDCKCDTAYVVNPLLCGALPPKWAAIIIVISFFAFVVVAVDCVLYCKNTGCLYKATHLCCTGHPEMVDSAKLKTTEERIVMVDDSKRVKT